MQQRQQEHQEQMQMQTNLMIAFLASLNPNALQVFQQLQAQSPAPPTTSATPPATSAQQE
jgi:hypothetical protein